MSLERDRVTTRDLSVRVGIDQTFVSRGQPFLTQQQPSHSNAEVVGDRWIC